MSQLFASGGQSIGVSASATVLPMNIQAWFPIGLTGLILMLSKGRSRGSLAPLFQSISSLALSLLYGSTLPFVQDYWENHSFKYIDFPAKWCLCFLICQVYHSFFPPPSRSKRLFISWLQSPSTVILELKKIKSVPPPLFPLPFVKKWWDWIPWSELLLFCLFLLLSFKTTFHFPLSSSRGSLVPLYFLPLVWYHL